MSETLLRRQIASTPEAVEAAFLSMGLYLPATEDAPARLADAVSMDEPGGQIGPGTTLYVVPPILGPDGLPTNPGDVVVDPRRLYSFTIECRWPPFDRQTSEADLDAVIAAAWPGDPATLGDRLDTLGAGLPLSEDAAPVVTDPVNRALLILRLWLIKGEASDDPVLGPVRTLLGVSLLLDP
ncbi:MAG: hypothetical protein N4A39_16910 [Roseicyclus sp.]|jgi:hypothetical protein|nr:hypothetical protein [Roseicyclus sp.]